MEHRQKRSDNNFRCSWDRIVFIAAITVVAVALIKRCRYGFGNIDESFYLTIPYRLVRGDSLLDTEWHLSQLSGVLLLPAMKIFLAINGGTEGIILAFRYIFTAVQIITAVIIFVCVRKYSRTGAIVSAVLMAAYAPFGIPALSYNSMGIISLTLATVLLFFCNNRLAQCVSGVLYSWAVLCCPYLAVLVIIYYAAFLASGRADKGTLSELTERKKILSFTVGILISAAIFLIFLLSRSSISKIIESFPFIMSDPEHQSNIREKCIKFILSIVFSCGQPWIFPCFALLFVTGLSVREERIRHAAAVLAIALSATLSLVYFCGDRYINYFMFPLNLAAPVCAACMRNKKLWKIIRGMWLPGIIYAVCIHFSSNQAFYAISSASAVSLTGSVIIAAETVGEICGKTERGAMKVLTAGVLAFAVIAQGTGEIYSRLVDVFWDSPVSTQTVPVEIGPEKGLLVTPAKRDMYYDALDNLAFIDAETEKILFLSCDTWLYLCGDWDMCTYSAWLSGVDGTTMERLHGYYDINKEKLPDCVFIEKDYLEYADEFMENYGFTEAVYTPGEALILTK